MSTPPRSSMRSDVLSAYVAAGAKVLSWVVVAGLLYQWGSSAQFALIAFVRSTLGILNYITFGISPAIMRLAARSAEPAFAAAPALQGDDNVLSYATPPRSPPPNVVFSNAIAVSLMSLVLGVVLLAFYVQYFDAIFPASRFMRSTSTDILLYMGIGLLIRLLGETPGAVLQSRGQILLDSGCVAFSEALWVVLAVMLHSTADLDMASAAAMAFFISAIVQFIARTAGADKVAKWSVRDLRLLETPIMRNLLGFGLLVTLSQLADYLYAPADYILISRFLGAGEIATFAPAVQIDAALLLLVSGLAAVILPKTAIADAGGDLAAIRRYYVKGTLASAALLLAGSVAVYFATPWIFPLWFGNPMEETRRILPLLLIATVIGGSSAVGRSVLLGMGRVAPFTIAALIAGFGNVALGYAFAVPLGLGLRGIILATIVVVVARCAIWMPWYVLRSLNTMESARPAIIEPSTSIPPVELT